MRTSAATVAHAGLYSDPCMQAYIFDLYFYLTKYIDLFYDYRKRDFELNNDYWWPSRMLCMANTDKHQTDLSHMMDLLTSVRYLAKRLNAAKVRTRSDRSGRRLARLALALHDWILA